jgi:alpha-amylase
MIRLLWAIHDHQPVGNFEFIFERAFERAYSPFIEVLERHPRIRISLHFSGILLDWLEANKPDYISKLKGLVHSGQIEILGGAHYEPILAMLTDADREGQVRKLSDSIKRVFGEAPRGMWLAERVWEPGLVASLARAGIEYVLLDGSHFKMVGKTEADMDGYFLTEDQGESLALFPIHDAVRDWIPFRPVEEVVAGLRQLNRPGEVQIVFGDDGEKFGDWPHTYETVYENGWLERFFSAMEARRPGRCRSAPGRRRCRGRRRSAFRG